MNSFLTIGAIALAAFLINWVFARAIVWMLARSWRAASEAHWTERARLAFAPGQAQLWFGAVFPPALAVIGTSALQVFAGMSSPDTMVMFLDCWFVWRACSALSIRQGMLGCPGEPA